MSGGKTLFVDYSKCIGCETCEAVCRFIHDVPCISMTRTKEGLMVPLYCRHCEKPHCARACPRGALIKDKDGAVILQPMLCRGCETRQCVLACPYSALFLVATGVAVRKCDICAARRALGLGPACAEMCPCGAVKYVERSELPAMATQESEASLKKVMEHLRPALQNLKRSA